MTDFEAQEVNEPTVTTRTDFERDVIESNLRRSSMVSWGAIFGGLATVAALSWLLYLLGLALGVSIADATDATTVSTGFGIGATAWIILSSLTVFFIGSILAARLSGTADSTAGMMHGLILWSVATVLMLFASYWGVTSLLQTGVSMVGAAGSAAAEATNAIPSAGEMLEDAEGSALMQDIQARMKRRASTLAARAARESAGNVSSEEIQTAFESLESETLANVAMQLAEGERTSAIETLASETGLSTEETRAIVNGVEDEFEEQLGTDGDEQSLRNGLIDSFERRISDYVAELDAENQVDVSRRDIRTVIDEVDSDVMETIAWRIVQGESGAAKDALINNTSLTRRQVNDVVEGVYNDVEQDVEQFQEQMNEAAEAASTYAQGVLWSVFAAFAMGLAICLLGGSMGAEATRTLEIEKRHVEEDRLRNLA